MLKVLITDDSKAIHSYLSANLDPQKFELDHAYDGEEAVKKVRNGEYQIVLLDWEMPKLDGIDALEQIRAFDSNVKIVMVTSKSSKKAIAKAFGRGANGFIKKPFDLNHLQQTMDQKSSESHSLEHIKLEDDDEDSKKWVLVCDDEEGLLHLVHEILDEVGDIEVVEAKDGEQALEALQFHHFDAIITDLNMPKLNGMQLIQKIKADRNHQFTPLYILSGEVDQMIQKYARNNLVTILDKPFDPDQLIDRMQREVFAHGKVPGFDNRVINGFVDSCADVLNCNFGFYRTGAIGLIDQKWKMNSSTSYLGIIGSGIRGNLVITCDDKFIKDLLHSLFCGDTSMIDDNPIEYLGELVNQLGGRLIAKLRSLSLLTQITVPESFSGENDVTWLSEGMGIQLPIRSRSGDCLISLFLMGINPDKITNPENNLPDTGVLF